MLSFIDALMYALDERGGWKQILIGIGIASIPIFGFFAIKGWEYEVSVRVRHGLERKVPGWDQLWLKFRRGVVIRITGILFNIPTYIVIAWTVWLWFGPMIRAAINPDLAGVPLADAYGHSLGLRVGMIFISFIVAFLMNSLYWSGYLRYIDTRRYSLFFDLVTNFELVILTIADDLIMMVYLWVATLIMGLVDIGLTAALSAVGLVFIAPFLFAGIELALLSMMTGYWFGEMAINSFGPADPAPHERPRRDRHLDQRTRMRRSAASGRRR